MTATDELRRLLDERGVEWMPSVWSAKDETFYKVGEVGYLATELSSGRMKVCIEGYPTPEQAIEATLGRGTCEVEAENAKLRELVRDMWHGAMQRMDYAERYAFAGEFADRMRELGVEEDDE